MYAIEFHFFIDNVIKSNYLRSTVSMSGFFSFGKGVSDFVAPDERLLSISFAESQFKQVIPGTRLLI